MIDAGCRRDLFVIKCLLAFVPLPLHFAATLSECLLHHGLILVILLRHLVHEIQLIFLKRCL